MEWFDGTKVKVVGGDQYTVFDNTAEFKRYWKKNIQSFLKTVKIYVEFYSFFCIIKVAEII